MTAEELISVLGLEHHPEGGFYRETFRHRPPDGGRGTLSLIYFLLTRESPSAWHRLDALEVWHLYAGAPLELRVFPPGGPLALRVLGRDVPAGEVHHAVVPPGVWQSARTLGEFTLVGCAVVPAFEFGGFELAPPGWAPGGAAEAPT